MTIHSTKLDSHLDEKGADGYLLDADGENSNQYYLSGYHAPDNFATLYTEGDIHLLVSELEYTRAKTDSAGDTVRKLSEFDYQAKAEEYGPEKARYRAIAEFVAELEASTVAVPVEFPVGTADALREQDVTVVPDYDNVLSGLRAVKTDTEIEHIRETQKANEKAVAVAEDLLAAASVQDGRLYYDGEVLTSERVRKHIEIALLEEGCGLDNCIVACGADSARAHENGSGPLEPGKPITVDIFPMNKRTRYNGDVTRTFVKGEPTERIQEWYELTYEAYQAALDTIEAGVTGETVHDAVCDVYEREGYPTLRTDESTEDGFFHSTGHGVGLDVHEKPNLGLGGKELQAGNVVTVEPGLYEQGTGGVRIEDLVVVTEDGYENLTDYPTELVLD